MLGGRLLGQYQGFLQSISQAQQGNSRRDLLQDGHEDARLHGVGGGDQRRGAVHERDGAQEHQEAAHEARGLGRLQPLEQQGPHLRPRARMCCTARSARVAAYEPARSARVAACEPGRCSVAQWLSALSTDAARPCWRDVRLLWLRAWARDHCAPAYVDLKFLSLMRNIYTCTLCTGHPFSFEHDEGHIYLCTVHRTSFSPLKTASLKRQTYGLNCVQGWRGRPPWACRV